MEIKVTETDIQDGVRGDPLKCPIARALQRVFPNAQIEVCHFFINIDKKSYLPSGEICKFISNFDNDRTVAPFSFDLETLKPW